MQPCSHSLFQYLPGIVPYFGPTQDVGSPLATVSEARLGRITVELVTQQIDLGADRQCLSCRDET